MSRIPGPELNRMRERAEAWARDNGLLRRRKDANTDEWVVTPAPISLTPASLPASLFHQAQHLQPLFNVLTYRIVSQRRWLEDLCERLAPHDPFIAQLLDVWKQSPTPSLWLGVLRSDYFAAIDPQGGPGVSLKQVELNTIAAALPYLAELITHYHLCYGIEERIPENRAAHGVASGMSKARFLFAEKHGITIEDLCCVMIVTPDEGNIYDQNGLAEFVGFPFYRLSLSEACHSLSVSPQSGHLQCQGKTVALVYYRAGYAPDHYVSSECWKVRLTIEQSTAVKVPDVGFQLAGLKKVQQELTRPHVLELFLPEDSGARQLQQSFVEILALDADRDGDANAQRALDDPSRWVLKPQREGGGNNIYGADIPAFLGRISRLERAAHVLMERITPMSEPLALLRDGQLWEGEAVSELGIYGVILVNDDKVVENYEAGYLVRSKPANVNEGGVATGFAYLNSVALTD